MGATLLGIGLVLTLMGIMLFFEGNLLRLGNVCILIWLLATSTPQIVHSNTIFWLFYIGCVDWNNSWSVFAYWAKQSSWFLFKGKSDTSHDNNINRYHLIRVLYDCALVSQPSLRDIIYTTVLGILMVFWGRPKIGLLIEIFGLLNLFG